MGLIVQKFGGTSVADTERLRNVARIITDTYKAGNQVVVVLSAQGDTTDDLIEKAKEINPEGSNREMDMLLSTGEQISVALCAMAIEALGYPVVSLTGWQAGILTDTAAKNARIKKIDTERLGDSAACSSAALRHSSTTRSMQAIISGNSTLSVSFRSRRSTNQPLAASACADQYSSGLSTV